jgi:hypothetical protein
VEQLIAVETTDTAQMREVEHRLLELIGVRPMLRQSAHPGQEQPQAVWRRARELTQTPMPALPLLLIIVDAWPQDEQQRRQLAEFWRGMNQLRESWHELPAQVLFLLSPAAYEHLTLNADHLKRWIGLKLRLWQGGSDVEVLGRPGWTPEANSKSIDRRWRLPHDSEGFLTGIPISKEELIGSHLQLLAHQAEKALERGEEPIELARRYYLPLISGYLALGERSEAMAWRDKIESASALDKNEQRMLAQLDTRLKDASMEPRFDVFLSYNWQDKPQARKLAQALRKRGVTVWLDEEQLKPGVSWLVAIENIIQTTRTAAVLIGGSGLGPWEDPEMRACLSQFVARRLPVIPVLLPNAPKQPQLPLFLQGFTWVDFRQGFTLDNLDRLIWGITGRKPPPRLDISGIALTHSSEPADQKHWRVRVWLQASADLLNQVDKVVFERHPTFKNRIKEVKSAPFEDKFTCRGSFTIKADIYMKNGQVIMRQRFLTLPKGT